MPTARPKPPSIFYNCPFDESYKPIFEAVIFCRRQRILPSELTFADYCEILSSWLLDVRRTQSSVSKPRSLRA